MVSSLRSKVADALTHIDGSMSTTEAYGPLHLDGFPEATDEIMTEVVTPLTDLLVTLHLYMSRATWTHLTTDQKNLLADLIDEYHASEYPDAQPMERWWQT